VATTLKRAKMGCVVACGVIQAIPIITQQEEKESLKDVRFGRSISGDGQEWSTKGVLMFPED
jgi:hypothetical protein